MAKNQLFVTGEVLPGMLPCECHFEGALLNKALVQLPSVSSQARLLQSRTLTISLSSSQRRALVVARESKNCHCEERSDAAISKHTACPPVCWAGHFDRREKSKNEKRDLSPLRGFEMTKEGMTKRGNPKRKMLK